MFRLNCAPLSLRQEEFSDGFWHCCYNFLICRMLGFFMRAGNPTSDLCVHPWLVSLLPPICLMGMMVWRDVCCVMCDRSFVFVLPSSSPIKKFAGVYSAASVLDRYTMSCKLTLSYMSASGANWLPVIIVLCGALRCGLIHNFSSPLSWMLLFLVTWLSGQHSEHKLLTNPSIMLWGG